MLRLLEISVNFLLTILIIWSIISVMGKKSNYKSMFLSIGLMVLGATIVLDQMTLVGNYSAIGYVFLFMGFISILLEVNR